MPTDFCSRSGNLRNIFGTCLGSLFAIWERTSAAAAKSVILFPTFKPVAGLSIPIPRMNRYFRIPRDPGVSGIDSHETASVLILPIMPSPALVRDDGYNRSGLQDVKKSVRAQINCHERG
jgi:hypothetical protein